MITTLEELKNLFHLKDERQIKVSLINKIRFIDNGVEVSDAKLQKLIEKFRTEGSLTMPEVCSKYHISQNTLKSLVKLNIIPYYKLAHGQGSKIIFLNSVLEKEHELNLFYYRGKNPFKFAKLFIGFFENVDIFTGRERDAIFMHFAEGKSIAEIARLLHTSRTRVNTIIKHASDKLLQKTRYLFSQMKVENSYQQKYEDLKINYDIVCNQFNQLLAKSGSDENIDFLKTRIVDYNLSIRCLNALRAAGIETIADLLSFSEEQLIRFRNFGKISLLEVKEFLKKHGFELRVYSEK